MTIKNIVFDVGNVLIKWSPQDIVRHFFNQERSSDELMLKLFKSSVWFDLNLGKLTEKEVIQIYKKQLGIPEETLENLMIAVRESLVPLEGSIELLEELYDQGYPLYSITDNVIEIVSYLKTRYDFFQKFSGIVVSGEIGALKPSPLPYKTLIESYSLVPEETLFIDDLDKNVMGAQAIGLKGMQFMNAAQCRLDLRDLGVNV
ncbi:MAG: HAD family phosphatase [Alphaproteobacteria bacterium]|nr:HAD family phosphatase [Alphaproteobacteria bacterium]